jgi:hypothetical protein
VEGLADSVPLFFLTWIAHWGEKDERENKNIEKEKNILLGHVNDLLATKLCTIIAPLDTKVALSHPPKLFFHAPKLLYQISKLLPYAPILLHQSCIVGQSFQIGVFSCTRIALSSNKFS